MQTYLVTGASGYIPSWIVKYLLEQGHTVHGTVRSLKNADKTAHLLELHKKYPENLILFEADLLNKYSFRPAMKGCDTIMHTASPFKPGRIKDTQKELIQPAIEGTRNVLSLASEFPSVKNIVVTSSAAAIYGDAMDIKTAKNNVFTEEDWNITSNEKHNPYQYSKAAAEHTAWEIAGEHAQCQLFSVLSYLVLSF